MTVHWFFLWSAILISVFGQTLLKAGAEGEFGSPRFLFASARPAHFRWTRAVRLRCAASYPSSVALPCTASSYVAAVVVGHVVFSEPVTMGHWMAVLVMGCGIVLLALAAR